MNKCEMREEIIRLTSIIEEAHLANLTPGLVAKERKSRDNLRQLLRNCKH